MKKKIRLLVITVLIFALSTLQSFAYGNDTKTYKIPFKSGVGKEIVVIIKAQMEDDNMFPGGQRINKIISVTAYEKGFTYGAGISVTNFDYKLISGGMYAHVYVDFIRHYYIAGLQNLSFDTELHGTFEVQCSPNLINNSNYK
jgi:hypothetical protein